jgi:hypothetical protein
MFVLGHIDPTEEHHTTSLCKSGSEATSESHEPLSFVRFAPLAGNLLIRDISGR